MMHLFRCTILVAAMAFWVAAQAETFSWTDSKGVVHYVDETGSLPKSGKEKVRKLEVEPAGNGGTDTRQPVGVGAKSTDRTNAGEGATVPADDNGLYDGRTYEQWRQELEARETALNRVRSQIDQVDEEFRKAAMDWDRQEPLLARRKVLAKELKDLRADYDQFVARARKAGLTINVQQ